MSNEKDWDQMIDENPPLPVTIPNAETVAAMLETNDPAALKQYPSFRELRERMALE